MISDLNDEPICILQWQFKCKTRLIYIKLVINAMHINVLKSTIQVIKKIEKWKLYACIKCLIIDAFDTELSEVVK